MNFESMLETYLTVGAGGLSLLVLVWMVFYLMAKINPTLTQIKVDNESHKEIIKNNTEAIREVSVSNQNVAQALSLLDNSFGTFVRLMEKHDSRAEGMENEIIKIRESTRECGNRKY